MAISFVFTLALFSFCCGASVLLIAAMSSEDRLLSSIFLFATLCGWGEVFSLDRFPDVSVGFSSATMLVICDNASYLFPSMLLLPPLLSLSCGLSGVLAH